MISNIPVETNSLHNFHAKSITYQFHFSVKTDLLVGGAMSRLYIANANRYDSGNYTCALADIAQATVSVHVLNGNLAWNQYRKKTGCISLTKTNTFFFRRWKSGRDATRWGRQMGSVEQHFGDSTPGGGHLCQPVTIDTVVPLLGTHHSLWSHSSLCKVC